MPARFCSDGAWRARGNSAVFLRSRDRDIEDAIVFPEIGGDGLFEDKDFTRMGTTLQSLGVYLHFTHTKSKKKNSRRIV